MRHRLLLAGLTAAVVAGPGCHRQWCRDRYERAPSGSRLDPPTRPSGIPPTSIPTTPPSNVPSLPPPEIPDSRSSFRLGDPVPPPETPRPPESPAPAEPSKPATPAPQREVLLPDPMPGPGDTVPTQPPGAPRRWLGDPVRPTDDGPAERVAEKPAKTAAAPNRPPAGFVRVAGRDGQATGRVPTGGELDWLAANGFKTVVLLHDPKADVATLRADIEKRNLRVLTIPVDAADLASTYETLARAVADKGGRPVYVADADPPRASALWYALFRKQELAGDEIARLRAGGLGAAPDTAAVWPAVQALLTK